MSHSFKMMAIACDDWSSFLRKLQRRLALPGVWTFQLGNGYMMVMSTEHELGIDFSLLGVDREKQEDLFLQMAGVLMSGPIRRVHCIHDAKDMADFRAFMVEAREERESNA